jgi:hypothetical protein
MRRALAVAALVLGLLTLGGPALAESPTRLAGQITDPAGVLGGGTAEIQAALDELRQANGTQLWVVYVRSFDGASGEDWAARTAQLSQFGRRDVLLAVAVDDRAYGTSVDASYPLSNDALDDIQSRDVEPRLSAGDWAGAAVAFADGLRTGRPADASSSDGVPVGLLVGGAAVVGGGAYLLARRRRRTTTSPAPAPQAPTPPAEPLADLAYRASAALIELDDAIQTSEHELGLAHGQFGADAVAEFRAALDRSRSELVQAFALRQRVDDEKPDEAGQRQLLEQILALCAAADERLDAESAAFDRLRDLEQNAPQVIAGLTPKLDAAAARLPEVAARLDALRARYAPSALAPVADNVAQARARLDVARTEIGEAGTELAAGDRAVAAVSARAAEEAIAQAGTLLDAVARLEQDLAQATARFAEARTEVEEDLAEAGTLPGDDVAAAAARASAALAAAQRDVAAGGGDPLAVLRRLDEAGTALEQALATARQSRVRDERAAAQLDRALLSARSGIAAASDFVSTRRGAVGSGARTRLAEAQRHLDTAVGLAGSAPVDALREAQHADALAQQALQLARADVERWSPPGASGGGIDLGSLILGGILLGGRGGGGGWNSGGRGGGFSPGSFGGSGTRGRRGGGGRF